MRQRSFLAWAISVALLSGCHGWEIGGIKINQTEGERKRDLEKLREDNKRAHDDSMFRERIRRDYLFPR